MTFQWRDYHAVANQLTGTTSVIAPEEARQRAAISRAYYAAFGHAKSLLLSENNPRITGLASDHRTVAKEFKGSQDLSRKQIARLLSKLRGVRNQADYEASIREVAAKTTSALAKAHQVIQLVDALFASSGASTGTSSMPSTTTVGLASSPPSSSGSGGASPAPGGLPGPSTPHP